VKALGDLASSRSKQKHAVIAVDVRDRVFSGVCRSVLSLVGKYNAFLKYRGADESLARPPSRFFSFDGENISFDASVVIYIYIYIYIYICSTNIPPIMVIYVAHKSLARPISFDASLVICINSNNIPPITIISKIYEHQNLLSL
jgi:hypothetical protein